MSKTTNSSQSSNTTRTIRNYDDPTQAAFQAGMNKYNGWGAQSGVDYLKGAATNSAFSTPTNAVQDAALARAGAMQNNSQLLNMANGNNLDVSNDPALKAQIERGTQNLRDQWAAGIDSVNGSMGRAGVNNSSMRLASQDKLAGTTQRSMADYAAQRQSAASDSAFQQMLAANNLLTNAGQVGTQYQQAQQNAQNSALENAARARGIDMNTWQGWMQLMQMARNPTETSNATASGSSTTNDPWGVATGLISKISFGA